MLRMVERKVRSRAQELYESRGQGDGDDLQDWFQAESEILGNKAYAPLYRRLLTSKQDPEAADAPDVVEEQASACEAGA